MAVCEALNELAPGDHPKRTALFNSGAEAVENAVKIARHVTGRQAVVVFDHAYHGRTNLTMALTAKNMPYRDGFGPFAPEVYRVPMSYPFRDPEGMTGERGRGAGHRADRAPGRGGQRWPACSSSPSRARAGSWSRPRASSRPWPHGAATDGVLLVADEIQTGFCRTGDWFACDDEGVVPDLLTTAKALAGGMPLAAVTGRAELMDEVHAGGLGGTYGGNPVACAAALAAIDHDADRGPGRRGPPHRRRPSSTALTALQASHPAIGDVRGRGAMMAMETGPARHHGARPRRHPADRRRPAIRPGWSS